MGFFNFFKKKEEVKPEIVLFEDMPKYLKEKNAEYLNTTQKPKNEVMELVIELIGNLEKEIEDLKEINLEEKKIQGRAKQIVENNLKNYVEYLNQLIKNLNQLNKDKFEDLSIDINNLFADFDKKSNLSFQKANYVVGKELEDIRQDLVKFFKHFNKITEENRPLIRESQVMESLKKYTVELEIEMNAKKEIDDELKEKTTKKEELENEIENITKNIEETKKSKAYIKNIENKKQLEKDEKELEKKLSKLKVSVNIKHLAEVFHSRKREMKTVKAYKSNFERAFIEDENKKLEKLVKDANENHIRIINSIKTARKLLSDKNKIEIKEDLTIELEEEIIKNNHQLKDLTKEIEVMEKKIKKIDDKLDIVKDKLKKEAIIINIQIE
jgi:DNA repair exonuclease SbcCD ATPase subunit